MSASRAKPIVVLLVGALALAAAPGAEQQQTQTRDSRATTPAAVAKGPTGTGVASGTVMADDGRPVRFAYVLLLGLTTGVVKVTSTDGDGRFTFADLPADRYTIGTSKAPYLGMIAGARRPGRTGTPIAIADGQKVSDIAIRMPMGGAISGTITDEKGEPGSGVAVGLQMYRMQNGERTLVNAPGGNSFADDWGRYRFYGLPPGDYVITALRLGNPPGRSLSVAEVDAALAGSSVPAAPSTTQETPAPTYFPGTPRITDAQAIALGLGEERANTDFRLMTVPPARVEGTVTAPDGQPVTGAAVMMTTAPGTLLSRAMSIRVGPDGRFSASGAMPGSYVLTVNGTGPLAGQFARSTLEIAGGDTLSVQLVMRPALTFSGRLVFEGASPQPLPSGRRVPIRAIGSRVLAPTVGSTNQAGAFSVTNVTPGAFLLGGPLALGPTSDTMSWALASVIVDGRDVTDLPMEIGDTAPKDVVVSYTDRWQELSGRLQSSSGAAVSDHTIIVFPEDKAYWIYGTRRIVTTRPGTDGRFMLSGRGPTTLPPGRYLLAAVTDLSRDEQFDPSFLSQIVPAAIPITLAPGEKKVQDLAIR